jgi:predicted porin
MVATESRWTPQWRTAFHYLKATPGKCSLVRAACNTNGLAGAQLGLGASYNFSKRTSLFSLYTKVYNGFAARYNNSDLQAPGVGEDVRQLALGISHSF